MLAITHELIQWMKDNKDERLIPSGTVVVKTSPAHSKNETTKGTEGVIIGGAHLDDPELPDDIVKNVVDEFQGAVALYAVQFINDTGLVSLMINTGIKVKK